MAGFKKISKQHIIIGIILLLVIFIGGLKYGQYLGSAQAEQAANDEFLTLMDDEEAPLVPNDDVAEEMITVNVKGAVVNSGVYSLPQGSRLNDALVEAGLLETANTDLLNLARVLKDEEEIIVPFAKEGEDTNWDELFNETQAIIVSDEEADPSGSGSVVSNGPRVVNINTAGISLLKTLPGIGDVKAAAIIAYREQHGLFKTIEEIKNVSGIGNATFENLKSLITVE